MPEMRSQTSQTERCPIHSCGFDGPVQRVLFHLRERHNADDLPEHFIKRLNLLRCQFCQKWFAKLSQHLSNCKLRCSASSSSVSSHDMPCVSQSQPVSGSSNSSHEMPQGSPSQPVSSPTLENVNTCSSAEAPIHLSTLESAAWEYSTSGEYQ